MNTTRERPYLPESAAMNSPSGEIFTPPNSSNLVKYSTGIAPARTLLTPAVGLGLVVCGVAVVCAAAPPQNTRQNKTMR
jgi:hypothetical protein